MTPRIAKARSGITLTEILISILIMGVGLISLATLFPLGLVRLRQAAQLDRSAFLAESAMGDLQARDLLSKNSFFNSWYGHDPFLTDTPIGVAGSQIAAGPAHGTGGGLPVCYDPLFRSTTLIAPSLPPIYQNPYLFSVYGITPFYDNSLEMRFGAGVVRAGASNVSFLRADPSGGLASAWGLQRITNFLPFTLTPTGGSSRWPFTFPSTAYPNVRDVAGDTFASPEDVVFSTPEDSSFTRFDPVAGAQATISTSPHATAPILGGTGTGSVFNDWKYTWFFTGRQTDVTNGQVFDGDIVICDSRPLAREALFSPLANANANVASGEYVFEAVFGYSSTIYPTAPAGYAVGSDRTVILRWPNAVADPTIKIGNWIADVTYERDMATSDARISNGIALNTLGRSASPPIDIPVYPMQRCHWYQIAKRTEPIDESLIGDAMSQAGWRRVTLYMTSPVRAKTLMRYPGGGAKGTIPVNLNAALFMPSVVNVFPRTVFTRGGN
jgi:hypothetical protein